MSTYATVQNVKDYVTGNDITLPDDARIQQLLNEAERYIDQAAGAWPVINTTTGRKFDPESLPAYQATALKYATCAQVEYMVLHGATFFSKAQHQVVRVEDDSGSEFRTGTLPYIGPKARRELEAGGLVRAAGIAMVPMGPRITGSSVIANNPDLS